MEKIGLVVVLAWSALAGTASAQGTAFRLEEADRGLRALADRAFVEGRRSGDGYTLSSRLGPSSERPGQSSGLRSLSVMGETGPDGRFTPRVVTAKNELTQALSGGCSRTRVWTAVLDLATEGVRVSYEGSVTCPNGTSAPDLEGDPRDEDGWRAALEEMLAAWSPAPAKRRFFDPWF